MTVRFGLSKHSMLIFALVLLTGCTPCSDSSCGKRELEDVLFPNVHEWVRRYVNDSPVLSADIGTVRTLSLQRDKLSKQTVWLDYSAEVYLEVAGTKGTGLLDLHIGGNSSQEISNLEGRWHFGGKSIPLGITGTVDTARVKYEKLKGEEAEFERAVAEGNCSLVLEQVARNEAQVKANTAYTLDFRRVSLAKATCLEKSGRLAEAAGEYERYAFFVRPFPFREAPDDGPNIEASRKYLRKAMELTPLDNARNQHRGFAMQQLDIQEKLVAAPCDDVLREALRQIQEKQRVHYRGLPLNSRCKATPVK